MKKIVILCVLIMPCNTFAMDWFKFIAGGVSCAAVHELSHMVVMSHQGTEYYINSEGMFVLTDPQGSEYYRNMAGFVGQHAIGTALTQWKPGSDFTKGYNLASTIITVSYPIRHGWNHDLSGGRRTEYAVFIGVDVFNLLRTDWK